MCGIGHEKTWFDNNITWIIGIGENAKLWTNSWNNETILAKKTS